MANFRKVPEAAGHIHDQAELVAGKARKLGPFGERGPGRSVALSATILLVLYFAVRALLEMPALPTWLRVVIALVPVPAFVWLLWAFITDARAADELERRIQLEALAMAFPLTLVLIMTLGLLEVATPLSPDDWSYRHIWPIIYVFYLFGLAFARRRYA